MEPDPRPDSKKMHEDSLFDELREECSAVPSTLESEISTYQSMPPVQDGKLDVLQWWSANRSRFPLLYKYAMYILPAQASEVASERAFSWAGKFFENGRAAMSSAILSNYLFIYSNDAQLLSHRSSEKESEDNTSL